MAETVLILIVGLELKHFLADYLWQGPWMLAGKGNFRHGGGYAHAGVHVLGSLPVLLFAGVPLMPLAMLLAAEFVIHYGLDYSKLRYARGVSAEGRPGEYWALHGVDQLLHQLTYAGMIYFAMKALAA